MVENRTMSEVEMDRLSEEAQDVALAASEFVPKHESWGFESYGDASGGIGGGVGGFLWFDSREALPGEQLADRHVSSALHCSVPATQRHSDAGEQVLQQHSCPHSQLNVPTQARPWPG